MKKLIVLLICLMAGVAQADTIGSLDTTTAGTMAWVNAAGYYRGSPFTATSTGTLDSMGGIFQFSAATGVKFCIIRASDSSIVDSTIIDTLGPDTLTFTLQFVNHDTIKTDSAYILMTHAGSAPYVACWKYTDFTEELFSESGHGQPGSSAWEDPISGLTLATTSGAARLIAYYTTGGEPPAEPTTRRRIMLLKH